MIVFLVLAAGLPYYFDLGPEDGLSHNSNLIFVCVLCVYLLSDILFLTIFGVSEHRKQQVNQNP